MPEKIAKKRISFTLTEPYLEALDRLVGDGVYADRGEAVKDALRRLFRHYGMEPFSRPLEEGGEEDKRRGTRSSPRLHRHPQPLRQLAPRNRIATEDWHR